MKKNGLTPHIQILCPLHARVHFCKDAVLLRLTNGSGRMTRGASSIPEHYDIFLDDQTLASARIPQCATCTGLLWRGYGQGPMSLEECWNVRDQINAGYAGLEQAIEAIAPLIGLFPSGLYAVADFDLFPVLRNDADSTAFFWEAPAYQHELQQYHCFGGSPLQDDFHDAPLYLFPTQPLSEMNRDRVDYYVSRLEEGDSAPRAIACYLNGAVSLLLDGHHKAAAAASVGVPVRCVVIFPLEEMTEQKDSLNLQRRLYFRHNKSIDHCSALQIEDGAGNIVANVQALEHTAPQRKSVFTDSPTSGKTISLEHHICETAYPDSNLLAWGTLIPPDRIQEQYQRLRENLIFRNHADLSATRKLLYALQCYDQLFPDSKGLRADQRRWLKVDAQNLINELW